MKPTLIIAEDIETIRDSLRKELEGTFEIVALAENGRQALQASQTHRPQLVLMDVVMPEMSGIDATRRIHEEIAEPPKVVILSGIRDESVVLQALAAGASDYLIKPTEISRIKAVLLGYIKEAQTA